MFLIKYFKKIGAFILLTDYRRKRIVGRILRCKRTSQNKLWEKILYNYLIAHANIIIGSNAQIGAELLLPHPQNIVIGKDAIIGDNCTIYHDVTLGQNRDQYPVVGNNVIIYAGAKIIGNVHVGDNAIVGANAVVTKDIPANAIVVGIPARVLRYRTEKDEFY